MSRLNAARRKALPADVFALPGRRFPIPDENHARAALSMAHNASPAEQATIRAKVHARYPQIGHRGGPRNEVAMAMMGG
jgi:hypothetical protein